MPAYGHYFRWLVIAASMVVWSGCSLRTPLQTEYISDLSRLEYRKPDPQIRGIVIGVPHGKSEPAAIDYATSMRDRLGGGLVIAYGFSSHRIAVTQPVAGVVSLPARADTPSRRRSIYPEFKALLRKIADGRPALYIGIRMAARQSKAGRIEIATTGFTFEQLRTLKESLARIRDPELTGTAAPVVNAALDPREKIAWSVSGVRQHGVLMLAERGLEMRLPASLSSPVAKHIYKKILNEWIGETVEMIRRNPSRLAQIETTVFSYGKIESIPGKHCNGVVVGAPHGTFDVYTSQMVRQICARTGLAGVIATGFTPTETGGGWRINVNRPSERYYPPGNYEIKTSRAASVYQHFKKSVMSAINGDLRLYVEVHQNGGERIEVATVGFSKAEAQFVRDTYRLLRDEAIGEHQDIAVVDLAIEPIDQLEVGAWAAKSEGIFSEVKKGLHFELPADGVMGSSRHREIYTRIMAELIGVTVARIAAIR